MNYSTQFSVKASPSSVLKALTQQVISWWGKVDANVAMVGDEFSIYFGTTEWRFKVTQLTANQRMEWLCIKAHHEHNSLSNIREEWLNTIVIWDLQEQNDETIIKFTHKGLTSKLNCYEVCKTGWDYYLLTSLKDFVETGKGAPYLEEATN